MKFKKIIFRADGGGVIGYGHVHRLLSLAQMLHKNFNCTFVSHETPDFLQEELQQVSIPLVKTKSIIYKLPDEKKMGEEVAFDMQDILTGNEIVVLDGYWFGKKYQQSIKKMGCIVVYVDDLMEAENGADIIINHSLGISISDYKMLAPATCVYTGSNYSLINVPLEFLCQQADQSIHKQLLIAMGGADPFNFTCKILREQNEYINRFEKVIVMTGAAYTFSEELKTAATAFTNMEIMQAVPKLTMFATMQQSTAAIISSSTMALEYAHIGGALGIVQTADNQKNIYKGMIENAVALPLKELATATTATISKIKINQKKIFDGHSGRRFIKLFEELQVQASFSFVNAAKEHLETTYQWASDPSIRAYSFNQSPIVFEEHQSWFLKKIEQPSCMYLLGKWENNIVGSLRFDITNNRALISYLVAPLYQGKGMGRIILAKGLEYLATNKENITVVNGYVMTENIASIKVFERLGFSCTTENHQLFFSKNMYR